MQSQLTSKSGPETTRVRLASNRLARRLVAASGALVFAWLLLLADAALAQAAEIIPSVTAARVVSLEGDVELDDLIEVSVTGLAEWSKTQGHSPWRLVPYINGRALNGLYPVAVNVQTGKLQFHLRMTPENRASWHNVLSPPTLTRKVRFSVGLELQDPFETELTRERNAVTLIVMELGWALAALAVGALFALSFFWLAISTPLLMERAPTRGGAIIQRFSLAKVQLAIWFFIVFGAFVTIWLATGNHDTLNGSIVATLGISAGTALGDSYIKSNRDVLSQEPREAMPIGSETPAGARSIGEHPRNRGGFRYFLRDLLSDSDGYSIYRFQMVAWTTVLTTIFLANVYYDLVMPEFRPDLLYLLGLSSGTYVAHRFPETLREIRASAEPERSSKPPVAGGPP